MIRVKTALAAATALLAAAPALAHESGAHLHPHESNLSLLGILAAAAFGGAAVYAVIRRR